MSSLSKSISRETWSCCCQQSLLTLRLSYFNASHLGLLFHDRHTKLPTAESRLHMNIVLTYMSKYVTCELLAVTSMNMCGKHIHQENKDMFRSLWFKICWHQLFRGNATESPLSIKLLFIYRTSGIQLHSRPHPIEAGVDLVVTCLRLEKIDLVELERAMGESPENYSSRNLQNPLDCSGSDSIPNLFVQGLNAPFATLSLKMSKISVVYCFVSNSNQAISTGKPLAPPWLSAPDSDQNLWTGKQCCTANQNSSVSSKGPNLHDKVGWNLLRNGETMWNP